jgi:hypothetical protein
MSATFIALLVLWFVGVGYAGWREIQEILRIRHERRATKCGGPKE